MKQWKTSNPCNLKFEATRTRERERERERFSSVTHKVCVWEREREKRSVPKRCSIVVEEWETTSIDRKEKEKKKKKLCLSWENDVVFSKKSGAELWLQNCLSSRVCLQNCLYSPRKFSAFFCLGAFASWSWRGTD